jgi:hypothetical protein
MTRAQTNIEIDPSKRRSKKYIVAPLDEFFHGSHPNLKY